MDMIDVKDLPTEELEEKVMKMLVSDAAYAIRSNNRDCVYECYGEAYARTVTAEDINAGRNWRDK